MTAEQDRLQEADEQGVAWRHWGPYLSERQWGTVREDYSAGGDAWNYFTHDQARSRAYRWGEDGLGGIREIADRLARIFVRDENGHRPVYGGTAKFQNNPYWRDYILFYEYFHGDNGAGLGASHQTGWTGIVAKLIQLFGALSSEEMLQVGKEAGVAYQREQEA